MVFKVAKGDGGAGPAPAVGLVSAAWVVAARGASVAFACCPPDKTSTCPSPREAWKVGLAAAQRHCASAAATISTASPAAPPERIAGVLRARPGFAGVGLGIVWTSKTMQLKVHTLCVRCVGVGDVARW